MSLRFRAASLCALTICSLACAAQAHDHALTFRDIEFDYPREQRLAVAQSNWSARLPLGTPIDQAKAMLRQADARCPASLHSAHQMVCKFSFQDMREDRLHDIMWTIALQEQNGALTGMTIDRQSYGM